MPVVLQINHIDDDNARPREDLEADLNPYGFPTAETVARSGRGIDEAHKLAVDRLVGDIRGGLAGASSGCGGGFPGVVDAGSVGNHEIFSRVCRLTCHGIADH